MVEQIEFQLELQKDFSKRQDQKESGINIPKECLRGIPAACVDEYGNAYFKYPDGSKVYVN